MRVWCLVALGCLGAEGFVLNPQPFKSSAASLLSPSVSGCQAPQLLSASASRGRSSLLSLRAEDQGPEEPKKTMTRPLGDNIVTKAIYSLEMFRIQMSKEKPTEENGGWEGEPREWAETSSLAQAVSEISQKGVFASFKQWIAESIAGEYDAEAINSRIDDHINGAPVAMFSFTTCPFCLKSKQLFAEELGISPENFKVIECDEDPEGNAIRAELGKRTGRTSMPSIWIRDEGYIGGCNDGPGAFPLYDEGKLQEMLKTAGALK